MTIGNTRPLAVRSLTGITERSRLIREGLEALIQREAERRLARLGGSAPDIQPMSRRRPARRGD